MSDSLGDRMKENYENRDRHHLLRRTPVVVRVDGRAFHTYTKGLDRPFDSRLSEAMQYSCLEVMAESTGCVAAYTQSDEASFLFIDYSQHTTQAWFDYDQSKIESITASIFTAAFNDRMQSWISHRYAHFDSRAFNLPREEVYNYFLWRAKDWERNSLQMFARANFSHSQLQNKNSADIHEMLHTIGKNWASDVSPGFRNGTWIISGIAVDTILPNYKDIEIVLKRRVYCDDIENTVS